MKPIIPHNPERFVREVSLADARDLLGAAARGWLNHFEDTAPRRYSRDVTGTPVGPVRAVVIGQLVNGSVVVVFLVGELEDWRRVLIVQADEERPTYLKPSAKPKAARA